jgi:hypothetical protein
MPSRLDPQQRISPHLVRTIACASSRHDLCLGTVMHKDYPRVQMRVGPCECPHHRSSGADDAVESSKDS